MVTQKRGDFFKTTSWAKPLESSPRLNYNWVNKYLSPGGKS